MRIFASVALLASALLASASASADEPSPPPSSPAPAAPPAAAPPVDVAAPAPTPGPGYGPPYAGYAAPGSGAPPRYWVRTSPVTERRSNGLRITGIVLLSAGGLASVFGATLFGMGANCVNESEVFPTPTPRPGPAPASASGQGGQERIGSARQALNTCSLETPGIGLFLGGLVTAVAGIPLLVIGSKQIPAGPMKGAILPAVAIGAGSGSLRWTF